MLKLHLPPEADPTDSGDAQRHAARELIRPFAATAVRSEGERGLPPYSRAWFEELEQKRHAGAGRWLRTALEVTRHASETLLMLTPGAGSDAAQYHRHGTEVTVCLTPSDPPDLLPAAFKERGLAIPVRRAPTAGALPFPPGRFDLAYLNLLADPPPDLGAVAAELYRVLKPGGKILLLAPARFDALYWQRVVLPWRHWYCEPLKFTDAPRHTARGLGRVFGQFDERSAQKRHVRKAELPAACRALPAWLTGRLMGRVLVFKAFKPVSAAYSMAEAA